MADKYREYRDFTDLKVAVIECIYETFFRPYNPNIKTLYYESDEQLRQQGIDLLIRAAGAYYDHNGMDILSDIGTHCAVRQVDIRDTAPRLDYYQTRQGMEQFGRIPPRGYSPKIPAQNIFGQNVTPMDEVTSQLAAQVREGPFPRSPRSLNAFLEERTRWRPTGITPPMQAISEPLGQDLTSGYYGN